MAEWATLISNVGVGGGLAVLFAWYLLRSLIPSLTKTNQEQRDAFLAALREERREFLSALRELQRAQESGSSLVGKQLAALTHEVEETNSVITSIQSRLKAAQES